MKPTSYLRRIPDALHQIEVLLHVPHFVAAGNREAAFHLRMALAFLVKAVRVHRNLAPYQTHALPDLVYGDGASIEGLPAGDPWRQHLEPFLALELPRSRVRDRREGTTVPVAAEDIRDAAARLSGLLRLATSEMGGGRALPSTPSKRSIAPPTSIWRAPRDGARIKDRARA